MQASHCCKLSLQLHLGEGTNAADGLRDTHHVAVLRDDDLQAAQHVTILAGRQVRRRCRVGYVRLQAQCLGGECSWPVHMLMTADLSAARMFVQRC